MPSVSEKFLQLVRKVREQQQEQQTQQQKQQQEDQKAEETPAVIKNDRPIAHYLHLARAEVEFMGHTLDMIKDGLFMLPHATKAQSLASIQATEIATQLEGKKAVLVRAADRIRNAAHALEETIAKDHEGYLLYFPFSFHDVFLICFFNNIFFFFFFFVLVFL